MGYLKIKIYISIILIMVPSILIGLTDNKKVLLINSYHKGYLWSDKITEGVETVLKKEGVELHIEYLDTKRQFNDEYLKILSNILDLKYKKHNYDLIITSDNNAYDLVLKYRESIFKETPIIFCGVNYFQEEDIVNISNITGINERGDILGNINLIDLLHPTSKEIVIITDNTETGQKIQEEVRQIQESYTDKKLSILYDYSLEELLSVVSLLKEDTIVLLTFFFRDNLNDFYEYNIGIPQISRSSSVPVYGVWDFSLDQGVVGGLLVDGYKQGLDTGKKAIEILNGTKAQSIPIMNHSPTTLYIDYTISQKFGIDTSSLKNVNYINRPISFYTQYKELIFYVVILFILLVLTLLAVSYGFIKSKKAEKMISKIAKEYKTLVNNIPGVTFRSLFNDGYSMLIIGDGIEDITGYRPVDLIDNKKISFELLIHSSDKEMVNETVRKAILDKNAYSIEYRIRNKVGNIRWVFEKGRGIYNESGDFIYIDGIFIDITQQKHIEYDLNEYRKHLEELVNERTSELQESLNHLKVTQNQLIESKKMASLGTLVTGVAHELNTPIGVSLTSITHTLDLITKINDDLKVDKLEKSKLVKSLNTIVNCVDLTLNNLKRLNTIVSNFKKVAVDQSLDDKRIFNLYEYIKEILENFYTNSKIGKHKIIFNCPKEIEIDSYPGVLTRIFSYLISNSINHGFKNIEYGEIYIDIKNNENNIDITFSDNGSGIDIENKDLIFDPFYTTSRGEGYQGLGLHIVYNLVTQKLNGLITYDSAFLISIPK